MRSLVTWNRFWFGTTIKVSTWAASDSMPVVACFMRLGPSNSKGFVTTPTVRMPFSRAALAITGAAPVPVPPPMPAVMKTMLQSVNSARTSSIDSSAACLPISGLEPAPRPAVRLVPSWILRGASEWASACPSVLATRKSTPSRFALIILLTALHPAPPTPITVIRGRSSCIVCGTVRLILMLASLHN